MIFFISNYRLLIIDLFVSCLPPSPSSTPFHNTWAPFGLHFQRLSQQETLSSSTRDTDTLEMNLFFPFSIQKKQSSNERNLSINQWIGHFMYTPNSLIMLKTFPFYTEIDSTIQFTVLFIHFVSSVHLHHVFVPIVLRLHN